MVDSLNTILISRDTTKEYEIKYYSENMNKPMVACKRLPPGHEAVNYITSLISSFLGMYLVYNKLIYY